MDTGWDDACAIRVDGTAECWRPTGINAGTSSVRVKVGHARRDLHPISSQPFRFACGVRADGTGFCWGDGIGGNRYETDNVVSVSAFTYYGKCMGHPDGRATCYPRSMDSPQDDSVSLRSVATGRKFGCGLDGDNLARCWGPVGWLDAPDEALKFIAAGGRRACGIKESDDSLMCWEWSYPSNWRTTGPLNEYTHKTDEPDGEFIHVDTSYGPSCAVRVGGDVICWGRGSILSQAYINRGVQRCPGRRLPHSLDRLGHVRLRPAH